MVFGGLPLSLRSKSSWVEEVQDSSEVHGLVSSTAPPYARGDRGDLEEAAVLKRATLPAGGNRSRRSTREV